MNRDNVIPFPASDCPRGVVEAACSAAAAGSTRGLSAGEIWSAISAGRIEVHYQPQYGLSCGTTLAAEALVRLVLETGEVIYPDRFIERAENSDLIIPLGRAVIEQTCADLRRVRDAGGSLDRIAINVSARQLALDPELPDLVSRTVRRYGLSTADLEFELTERQDLATSATARSVIQQLAERGSRIALDDFGLGFSSIAHLADLPVSAIKVDRSMIAALTQPVTRTVVRNLVTLAEDLGLDLVAEGIETAAQQADLVVLGCRIGQGFGFAKPLPVADLLAFLATGARVLELRPQLPGAPLPIIVEPQQSAGVVYQL